MDTTRKLMNGFLILIFILTSCERKEEVTIIKKKPSIIWSNPEDIFDGTALSNIQLNAESDIDGSFNYIPPANTFLKVGSNQELKVIFTPTDKDLYDTISKITYINVLPKENLIIKWQNPDDIYYGTLLSDLQLNASADVDGTFSYTPDFSAKLYPKTNQKLTVIFTPTNLTRYNIAYDTVSINVLWPKINFNENLVYGTMTDQDGNVYKTITIGSQTWMAENLRVTTYANGDNISYIESYDGWTASNEGAYCWMGNDKETYKDIYGALYNFYTIKDSRSIAPIGWHVPSLNEWNTLISYLGGIDLAGNKLREKGTSHWAISDIEGTNESGFTALPGGHRETEGSFVNYRGVTHSAEFWTNTNYSDPTNAYAYPIVISKTGEIINYYKESKSDGKYIRLIKD